MANITVSTTKSNVSVNTSSNVITVTSTPSNISVTTAVTPLLSVTSNIIPASNNTFSLGNATNQWKTSHIQTSTVNDLTATNNISAVNGSFTTITTTGDGTIGSNLTVSGVLQNVLSSNIDPNANNTHQLGNATNQFKSVFSDKIEIGDRIKIGNEADTSNVKANLTTLRGITFTDPGDGNTSNDVSLITYATDKDYIFGANGNVEGGNITLLAGTNMMAATGEPELVPGSFKFGIDRNGFRKFGLSLYNDSGFPKLYIPLRNPSDTGYVAGAERFLFGQSNIDMVLDADKMFLSADGNILLDGANISFNGNPLKDVGNLTFASGNGVIGNLSVTNNVSATHFIGDGSALTNLSANTTLTNAQAKAHIESTGLSATANLTTTANIQANNIIGIINSNANIDTSGTLKSSNALGLAVTGNATIGGNLNVTGNVNSANVVDLFVEDRNITLQFGTSGTPSANSQIFVDRGSSANSFIIWNESNDKFGFSNDGSNITYFAQTTDDLAEGSTNLYFTNARANAVIGTNTTDNLSEGSTNLYYTDARSNSAIAAYTGAMTNATGNITTTANVAGANFIGNVVGNVTGSPSSLAGLDTADLTEGTNLYFTNARANAAFVDSLDNITTAISSDSNITTTANVSGAFLLGDGSAITNIPSTSNAQAKAFIEANGLDATANITTTGNISGGNLVNFTRGEIYRISSPDVDNALVEISDVQNIISAAANSSANVGHAKISFPSDGGTGSPPNGQVIITSANTSNAVDAVSGNIQLKSASKGKTLDFESSGYALTQGTLPATTTLGDFAPSVLLNITTTAGSNAITVNNQFGSPVVFGLRGPTFATVMTGSNMANVVTGIGVNFGFGAHGLNNPSAGLYGQDKGWTLFNAATGSRSDIFPLQAFATGISTNTITMSENALVSGTFTSVVMTPGMAQTTVSNTQFKYQTIPGTASNSAVNDKTLYGRLGSFEHPETLANLTYDAISYANTSSITFTDIGTKQSTDIDSGSESAVRYPRLLSIGPNTTPDPFSGRTETNNPSPVGVTVENDGETYTGNNSPSTQFLISSYTGALDDLSQVPNWVTTGFTGNVTTDMPQLKAPTLRFKAFRGKKSDGGGNSSLLLQSGDVIGKVAFGAGETTQFAFQGSDLINPPSAITVDVGSANINTGAANAHMHITTSPYPLGGSLGYFRNNENAVNGINQQTNFTTKDGNVTIAAQTDGMITLAPTPDYGDSGNTTVWTRFPGTTHEYHTFLDAKFLSANATSKSGTIIEVQPKSGTTTGSGGLGYDSVGNATVRISSHHSNSAVKAQWDITNEQSSGNLMIRDHTNSSNKLEVSTARAQLGTTLRLQNLTTAEINALSSPQKGDVVYNTTLEQVCFYNGTAWQKVTSANM